MLEQKELLYLNCEATFGKLDTVYALLGEELPLRMCEATILLWKYDKEGY